MNEVSIESSKILESLKRAVENALEKKKRLGQYAIIWQNNAPHKIESSKTDVVKLFRTPQLSYFL